MTYLVYVYVPGTYLVRSCQLELLGTCWNLVQYRNDYYSANICIRVMRLVPYAHDLRRAGLGAGREAGRPCVLATTIIHEVSCRVLCDNVMCIMYVHAPIACLMWPRPAVTITSTSTTCKRTLDGADACRNRHFITSTTT